MVQIATGLNTDPTGMLVNGLNTFPSGDEHWTITPATGTTATIATDDPDKNGLVPTVMVTLDLKSSAPSTLTFTASDGPHAFADSVGFTALMDFKVTNDTGKPLTGLTFSLLNEHQQMPINEVPGVISFGDTINANYAYLTDIQPGSFTGLTQSLFSPDNKATTATGAAANTLHLAGTIPNGGSVTGSMVVHNTEQDLTDNSFVMGVIPQ